MPWWGSPDSLTRQFMEVPRRRESAPSSSGTLSPLTWVLDHLSKNECLSPSGALLKTQCSQPTGLWAKHRFRGEKTQAGTSLKILNDALPARIKTGQSTIGLSAQGSDGCHRCPVAASLSLHLVLRAPPFLCTPAPNTTPAIVSVLPVCPWIFIIFWVLFHPSEVCWMFTLCPSLN